MSDRRYMEGDSELPIVYTSTDDSGGTESIELHPIAKEIGMNRRNEISAGRFVNPQYLPPVIQGRVGGGRLVNPQYLPPARTARIQTRVGIDWDNAYHFGKMSAECVRGSRRQG